MVVFPSSDGLLLSRPPVRPPARPPARSVVAWTDAMTELGLLESSHFLSWIRHSRREASSPRISANRRGVCEIFFPFYVCCRPFFFLRECDGNGTSAVRLTNEASD